MSYSSLVPLTLTITFAITIFTIKIDNAKSVNADTEITYLKLATILAGKQIRCLICAIPSTNSLLIRTFKIKDK